MGKETEVFRTWVQESNHIVFFGGAGVSTESKIPDFRSVDGLYNQEYDYPPEQILSHSFFVRNTAEFYRFYRNKMLFLDAEPNMAHKMLAKLEEQGKLKAVVTQNIDGLHQKAGSKNVLELHGSVHRNYCERCGKFYSAEDILKSEGADMLIGGGTSLTVYPAAGLVDYYRGKRLVLINKSVTALDKRADLLISDSIGRVFGSLLPEGSAGNQLSDSVEKE